MRRWDGGAARGLPSGWDAIIAIPHLTVRRPDRRRSRRAQAQNQFQSEPRRRQRRCPAPAPPRRDRRPRRDIFHPISATEILPPPPAPATSPRKGYEMYARKWGAKISRVPLFLQFCRVSHEFHPLPLLLLLLFLQAPLPILLSLYLSILGCGVGPLWC